MAITGTFNADFGPFSAAVDGAIIQLRDLETGSNKVGASVNRVANSLSGAKVIQDATLMAKVFQDAGGAASFTEKELARMAATGSEAVAKLRALGQDVPPGIARIAAESRGASTTLDSMRRIAVSALSAFGVAFSVSQVVQFGKALIDDAGALVDMSTKTGNSIEQLQRFAFVGKQANVSVDDLAQASFKLGVALEGGDTSVVKAVGRLGLSYDKLRASSPDEQFNQTVKALEGMTNEQERNRVGVDLFGKSWATVAPAIAKGYSDIAAAATVSSTAQITAIDDASDAWERWKSKQKTAITSGLGDVVLLKEAVAKLGAGYAQFLIDTDKSITSIDQLNAALIRAAAGHDINLPKQEKHVSLTKAEQEAADKLAAAMVELNAVGAGWAGTLDTIDGNTVEAIKYYLQAGVAQDKLATAYGLTAAQVKAVASSLTAEDAALKVEAKSIEATTKLWAEYNTLRVKHGGTANEIAIAQIDQWAKEVTAAAKAAGTDTHEFYEALAADSKEKRRDLVADWKYIETHSIESFQEQARYARRTYDEMLSGSKHFTREALEEQRQKTLEAEAAARGMGEAYKKSYTEAAAAAEDLKKKQEGINEALEKEKVLRQQGGSFEITRENFAATARGLGENEGLVETLLRQGYSFQQALLWAKHPDWPPPEQLGPRVPGFAGGVQNFGGGMALVGERGPEIVQLPRGANVIPGGLGGGVTVNVGIQVSGVMDLRTRRELAEAVKKEIMQAAMSSRQWGAA